MTFDAQRLAFRWAPPLAAVVFLCLGAVPVAAASPRALALGGGDIHEDLRGAFRWPGALPDYAGRWWLASGSFSAAGGYRAPDGASRSGPEAGIVVPLSRSRAPVTLGLLYAGHAADSDPGGVTRDAPGSAFTFAAGRRWGSVSAGALVRSSAGQRAEAGLRSRSRTDLGWGLRTDLGTGSYLDLAGDWRQRDILWRDGALDRVRTGGSWSARCRLYAALDESWVLAPSLEFIRERTAGPLDGESLREEGSVAVDADLLRGAIGLIRLPDPDVMQTIGVEFIAASGEDLLVDRFHPAGVVRERDTTVLTATVAMEKRYRWWLSLRGSAGWRARSVTGPGDGGRLMGALGATLHLGRVGLDAALTNREPRGLSGRVDPAVDDGSRAWIVVQLHRDF